MEEIYQKKFSILDDEKLNVIRESILPRSGREGDEKVIVDEIIASDGDEN